MQMGRHFKHGISGLAGGAFAGALFGMYITMEGVELAHMSQGCWTVVIMRIFFVCMLCAQQAGSYCII
jgi:hypothetical protein